MALAEEAMCEVPQPRVRPGPRRMSRLTHAVEGEVYAVEQSLLSVEGVEVLEMEVLCVGVLTIILCWSGR